MHRTYNFDEALKYVMFECTTNEDKTDRNYWGKGCYTVKGVGMLQILHIRSVFP